MADYLGKKIKFNIEDNDLQKIRFNKVYGESQQATRSGKNLYDVNDVFKFTDIVSVDNDDWITVAYDNSEGTSTKFFDFKTNINQLVKTSQNYKLIVEVKNISGTGVIHFANNQAIGQVDTTVALQFSNITTGVHIYNIPMKSEFTSCTNFLNSYGSFLVGTSGSITFRMSVLEDITITPETFEYEPYGVMPSPHYPSEIESVKGKNLFDKDNANIINTYLVGSGNGVLPSDGGTENNCIYIPCKTNTTYTIQKMIGKRFGVAYTYNLPAQGVTAYNKTVDNTATNITITTDSSANYLVVYLRNGNINGEITLQQALDSLQIEKGTVATPYVPYNSLEFKDVGSNVLELSKGTVTLNGVTLTSDGETITINGTVSGNYPAVKLTNGLKAATSLETLVNNYINERVAQLEDIKDCTIQSIISGGSSTFTPYIGSYNKTVRELWYGIGTPAKTIQTSSTSLIAIYLGGKGSTYNNYKIKIGINKGTVAKPYEPYKSQTAYFPLSEGQKLMEGSYLADDGIHHSRKQVVFDGSDDETWTQNGSKQGYGIVIDNVGGNAVDKVTSSVLCDKLTAVPQSKIYTGSAINGVASIGGTMHKLYVRFDSSITTVALLREKLAESPILIEYELAEEEIVPYTETQQEAREKLRHFKGLNGENNITAQGTMTSTLDLTLYNVAEEDFDIYISKKGYFGALKYDINNLIDFTESNIPSIAEATESSVKIAGRDGDISLNTVYEPLPFEIVCYTEDNLTPEEKIIEEQKITSLLNSIKNQTKTFFMEREKKFYKVKYSGNLSVVRYPKHLKFTIPLKSSESYAMNFKESEIIGNGTKVSNTIKDTGAIFTIKGPAIKPIISLNNYQMKYNENILEGNSLIINSEDSTITHITSAGVKTNAMRAYNHEFPKIKNGENQLAVSSGIDDEKQVNVKWYDLKI